MERGLVTGLLMNGAGCVHDLELAMMGHTSEDVAASLDDGSFGMAAETSERLNRAIGLGKLDLTEIDLRFARVICILPDQLEDSVRRLAFKRFEQGYSPR